MQNNIVLVLGNDKLSQKAAQTLQGFPGKIEIFVDRSTNWVRIFRLIRRGRLSPVLLIKMFICELRRPSGMKLDNYAGVASNADLVEVINRLKPVKVILFRAGLIISRSVIETGIPILNIHCARIPHFGGLGAISRALESGEYHQCATLHRVTTTIDSGEIYDTEYYALTPTASYCYNETVAYEAGIVLLQRAIAA